VPASFCSSRGVFRELESAELDLPEFDLKIIEHPEVARIAKQRK
jgi:hypothetical protein